MDKQQKMENIVSLAKRRGFIYPGSDVYGGLSGTWDFGPLGVQLKRNIMNLWWKMFVDDRDDMYGVDAAILMNQKVWQASGHVDTFVDPLVECKNCNPVSRHRVDKIINKDLYQSFLDDVIQRSTNARNNLNSEVDKARNTLLYLEDELKNDEFKKLLQKIQDDANKFKDIADALDNLDLEIENAKKYVGGLTRIFLDEFAICPICKSHSWTTPGFFNMMFETNVGVNFSRNVDNHTLNEYGMPNKIYASFPDQYKEKVYSPQDTVYLRPETAQGIFTNYKNVVDTFYPDLPFGIAQMGKAFRNEISPRDFIFRSREFEQMEIEYFVDPANWQESFEALRNDVWSWTRALGLPDDSVHELEVAESDRAHYSQRTIDFEFDFPIGREELLGLAYRTDFDLKNIEKNSGKNMEYTIKGTNTKFVPHVIEPSFGVERAVMAVLSAAYREDEIDGEKRVYLALPEHLAPVKYAVSPLVRNKPELVEKARQVYQTLKSNYGAVMWDDSGNIGKRYRRQDEIGTPYCVVVDFDTLENDTVTIRHRDTTEQERRSISEL